MDHEWMRPYPVGCHPNVCSTLMMSPITGSAVYSISTTALIINAFYEGA